MPLKDIHIFLAAAIISPLAAVFSEKILRGRQTQQLKLALILWVWMCVAVYFSGIISATWSQYFFKTGEIDASLMYVGVASGGVPYVCRTTVDSPTFFAFARFCTFVLGDGSRAAYSRFISRMNVACACIVVVGLLSTIIIYLRREKSPELGIGSVLCISLLAVIPVSRDIAMGNTNTWAFCCIFTYFVLRYALKTRSGEFLRGVVLGIGFMIKPHTFLILLYLFFSALRTRKYYEIGGIVVAGILGFFGSLLVPGINIDTYYTFFAEVPEFLVDRFYREHPHNLSIMPYLPPSMERVFILLAVVALGIVAYFASRKRRSSVAPWFFIANVPLPLIWGTYILSNAVPPAIFLILERKKSSNALLAASTMALICYSTIFIWPVVINVILIGLWLWLVTPLFFGQQEGSQ